MISDESVELQELSLDLHTSLFEMKPCVHGELDKKRSQQMSPEVLTKHFIICDIMLKMPPNATLYKLGM